MGLIVNVQSRTAAAPSTKAILYAEEDMSGLKVYEVKEKNTHRTNVFFQAKTAQPWYEFGDDSEEDMQEDLVMFG